VLESIREIKTRFLYIEFSNSRESDYELMELLDKIKDTFGPLKILFCDQITSKSTMGNLLVQFIEQ